MNILLALCLVATSWANEDLERDVRAGNIKFHELHKRSVLNVNSNNGNDNGEGSAADGIRYAAQQFANNNGNANRNVGFNLRSRPNGYQLINSCLNRNPRPTLQPTLAPCPYQLCHNYGQIPACCYQGIRTTRPNVAPCVYRNICFGGAIPPPCCNTILNSYNPNNYNRYSHNGRGKRSSVTNNNIQPIWPRTTTAAPPEQLNNRDLVFVLDTSGSIPKDQFEIAKTAISLLVKYLCPKEFGHEVTDDGTKQISVVLFGRTQTTEISFEQSHQGLGYLQDAILGMKHRREGATGTPAALKYVRKNILGKPYSRLYDARVATDVIVITDGQCNVNCQTLGTEADKLRVLGNGVNVFALGVAKARACELEIISGEGENLSYGLSDFNNLEQFAEAIKSLGQASNKQCA